MSPEEVAELAYGFKPYFIKHLGRDNAEDFTQELFLVAYQAMQKEVILNLKGWMVTTSRYLVCCEIDKLVTIRKSKLDLTRVELIRHSPNHPLVTAYVNELLRFVDSDNVKLIDLYFYGGKTTIEISRECGLSQAGVSHRILRSLDRISKAVNPMMEETKYKAPRKYAGRPTLKPKSSLVDDWVKAANKALIDKKSH